MLHSIDRWTGQVKLGGQLGDLRHRLALAVMQAVTRGDHRLSRTLAGTLAGKLLSLGCTTEVAAVDDITCRLLSC